MMRRAVLVTACISAAVCSYGQDAQYVPLKQEKMTYTPRGYFVADVTDDRTDNTSVGKVRGDGAKGALMLPGGAAAAINAFAGAGQDKGKQPVKIHISKLNFDVSKRGEIWNVDAVAMFSFFVADKKIIDYTSKGQAQMDTDPKVYIASFIRQALDNDEKKFDEWWRDNKSGVPVTDEVKLNVRMATTTDKPNSIVYTLRRQLVIPDFQGRVNGSQFELAVTESGIGVGYASSVQDGRVVLDVDVTPYFNKATSWFKPEGKNTRVLAHEQTHFDITAIKACELVSTLRNTRFTQENYEQLIVELQNKNAQEANDEEVLYDKETAHGTIADKQLEWEHKITVQVKACGCY